MLVEIEHFIKWGRCCSPGTRTWKNIKVDIFEQSNIQPACMDTVKAL